MRCDPSGFLLGVAYSLICLELLAQAFSSPLSLVPILLFGPSSPMAAVPDNAVRRRGAVRDEEIRNVRQRVDDVEQALDQHTVQLRSHEQRLQFVESACRLVLRGFECVPEFLTSRERDYRLAKASFITTFVTELRNCTTAEATTLIDEAEGLLCEHDGEVMVGLFPTGGTLNGKADGVLRLQHGFAGLRVGHLLAAAGRWCHETHTLFRDRVRRNKGEKGKGKDKGKGKGKGKPMLKGKGRGAQAKAAAAPL